MCSFFWREMENTDQGELADIVRAGGSGGSLSSPSTVDWQFHLEPTNNPPSGVDQLLDGFGDPFSNMSDPLLHELDMASGAATSFDGWNSAMGLVKMTVGEDGSGGSCFLTQQMLGDETKRSSNIFSRMLQINPTAKMAVPPRDNSAMVAASSRGIKPSPLDANGMVKSNTSMNSSVDNCAVQISTSRNPGIKRRKSQAKQVVCIPAPTPANNRPSGEVVPSDLWAWRKYGQKPIKGSPYPRGYYRCSSSKGCSARKQVERSRNDPNMLVITYTFEHNHPWPTQRNALAGSTRSQPMKHSSCTKSSSSTHTSKSTALKENGAENSSSTVTFVGPTTSGGAIKEEMGETGKEIPVDTKDHQYDQPFNHSCRPLMLDSNQSDDSLFADLGELEPDPLNLMFSQGFSTAEKSNEDKVNKALDPFNLFEW